jgi:hypothetical protein
VEVVPQARRLRLSLNVQFHEIDDPRGMCKDVSSLGRWGNGDVEVGLVNRSAPLRDGGRPTVIRAADGKQRGSLVSQMLQTRKNAMQMLTIDDPETKSADVVAENVEALKALFPEAFTEGQIDFEVLKQLLGGKVDERDEKYGLNWHGKRRARQIALTPSSGTLLPCPADSVDWGTTQNLMIEGDNLQVLKLLQKSYVGKVKLIYIDQP